MLFVSTQEIKFGQKMFQIRTERLSNMLFVFDFLAVNNLDAQKRRNPLKSHRTEQFVFQTGPYGFFRPSSR